MALSRRIVNPLLNGLTDFICKIDATQLAKIPPTGPLMLVSNHINFLEIPILYCRLANRPLTVFAKKESWDSLLIRSLFDLSLAIPVRRGEVDTEALRRAVEVLKMGRMLALAPEGTRSGTGQLQQAHPGLVLIAQRSGAPILPIAFYGSENYKNDWKRLRRTNFHIAVGNPFLLKFPETKMTNAIRRQMVDEVMCQIAALLPPKYRGYYSNLETATEKFLEFSNPSQSNLLQRSSVII
ncbi:MAG: 1-acyl-sn-glycerol-3-phosphate acyltransferase [Chloroflexi bacterium]|nr:1-acyl-sn-glycerol-3-phosphate acyltransferase [Chloroflexota bacterium]